MFEVTSPSVGCHVTGHSIPNPPPPHTTPFIISPLLSAQINIPFPSNLPSDQPTETLQRRAADRYRLRAHRARSVVLQQSELQDIRASQRTFEGAYVRTALSQFSFSLVIIKIFTREFYHIGALFAAFGFCILLVSLFRRQQGNRQFFATSEIDARTDEQTHPQKWFRSSGNVVVVMTLVSLGVYVALLTMIMEL